MDGSLCLAHGPLQMQQCEGDKGTPAGKGGFKGEERCEHGVPAP